MNPLCLMVCGSLLVVGALPVRAAPASALPQTDFVPEKVPVTLTATLTKNEFDADEPVNLSVTLQNNSDENLRLGTSSEKFSRFDIVVQCQKSLGNKIDIFNVARTSFGEDQLTGSDAAFGNIILTLPPKGIQKIVFPLRRMFDLSSGGAFNVKVTRTFQVNRERTVPPTGQNANGYSESYQSEIEVKITPRFFFRVEPPPIIEEKLTPLTPNRF